MKINVSLMKLAIRLLILMIFFVILFLILVILYSSRYWPDVYNYINANITIKRIPTISELNLTVFEVDFTTEFYTTEDYVEASTVDGIDINIDDFTNTLDDSIPKRAKRYALEDFGKDYSELPKRNVIVDYLFLEDPTTVRGDVIVTKIVKDLINESKLVPKNYGDVEIMDSWNEVDSQKLTDSAGNTDVSAILPWISTIFLKNDTKSNQFEYFCDGALLNDKLLITAARCVTLGNTTVDPDSLLVILGKRSLLSMADKEQAVKIKQIVTHENFTNENGTIENDLALLIFENPVKFNELIQPATIGNGSEVVEKSFTTAWSLQGDIVPVSLENTGYQACSKTAGENMLCAVYGLDVALCPSYGGLVAGRQAVGWRLYGVRSGDTADRGLCFDKHVWYTDLRVYDHWIMEWLQ